MNHLIRRIPRSRTTLTQVPCLMQGPPPTLLPSCQIVPSLAKQLKQSLLQCEVGKLRLPWAQTPTDHISQLIRSTNTLKQCLPRSCGKGSRPSTWQLLYCPILCRVFPSITQLPSRYLLQGSSTTQCLWPQTYWGTISKREAEVRPGEDYFLVGWLIRLSLISFDGLLQITEGSSVRVQLGSHLVLVLQHFGVPVQLPEVLMFFGDQLYLQPYYCLSVLFVLFLERLQGFPKIGILSFSIHNLPPYPLLLLECLFADHLSPIELQHFGFSSFGECLSFEVGNGDIAGYIYLHSSSIFTVPLYVVVHVPEGMEDSESLSGGSLVDVRTV